MSFRNWNLEWTNLNAMRRYPIVADATCVDVTSSFQIPDDFLVALYLPIGLGVDIEPGRFFILSLGAYASGYAVTIGYAADSGNIPVATALIASSTFTPNQSYALGGLGNFADSMGTLVIGTLDSINLQPAGQFNFSLPATALECDCIRPIVRGVGSILVQNGSTLSAPQYGTITIVAGTNMQITAIPASDGSNPQLIFDAIEGAGLSTTCVCLDESTPTPIYTINGIPPTAGGDFTLVGDDCIKIGDIANGLQFTDDCSDACCGCPELEVVTAAATQLATQANSLQNYISNLDGQILAMSLAVGNL